MTNVAGETSIGTILREFQVSTVHVDLSYLMQSFDYFYSSNLQYVVKTFIQLTPLIFEGLRA